MAAPQPEENRSSTKAKWLWLCFVLLVGAVVYSGYLSRDYIYDDEYLIIGSDYYQRPFRFGDLSRDLGNILCGQNMGYWRPGQLLLYRAQYELFEFNPTGWSVVALILHLIAASLFYFLIHRLSKKPGLAGMATLLFLLHPAVNEVVGSNNFQISSAEGIFAFAAILAWIRNREILAAGCMLAALSFRESALVLPVVFFLFLLIGNERPPRRRLYGLAWPVGGAVLYGIARYGLLDIAMLKAEESFGLISRVGLIASLAVRSIFLPLPSLLSVAHDPRPDALSVALGWLFLLLLAGALAWLSVRARRGKGRLPAVLLVCSLVLAAPYSGLVAPYILFAEHYFYLPLAFFIATTAALVQSWKRKSAAAIPAVILILLFGFISWGRAYIFQNNGAAFGHALTLYPDSITSHMSMGTYYYRKGDFERAANEYLIVLNLTDQKHEKAWNNLGDIYFRNKQWHDAEKCFLKAGKLGERNLAIVLFVKKQYRQVRPLAEKLAKENPDDKTIAEIHSFLESQKDL